MKTKMEKERFMKLYDGFESQVYSVKKINLPENISKRLEALGMVYGTDVNILNKSATAVIIEFRGTRFALGKTIAENIEVRKL
jgi:ferrous iron transport protein A